MKVIALDRDVPETWLLGPAIEAVRAEGGIIERVIVVVDRLEGAGETFKAAGIPFTAILTAADFGA